MPDKTLFIARNDPGKQRKKIGMDRKKLGKVKDLFEQMEDDFNEFDQYINRLIKNNKKGEIRHNA